MWGCRQYMRFQPSISFKPYPLCYPCTLSVAGVPNSQTMDRYWSVVCSELDHPEGGDREGIYRHPPITLMTPWPPVRSAVGLDSQSSMNSTVNCACKGCGLQASYENHPQTTPTSTHRGSMEKLSSTNLVSDAKKFGDHWSMQYFAS